MSVLEGLEPASVFHFFEEICNIPHGSGNEKGISDYLKKFAKDRGLFCIQDEWNNIIIVKEATFGYRKEEPIILQGHMDMVAVKKQGARIDMEKDPLKLIKEGDYIFAQDTSLGGDDGIAVAYALAILDAKDISHPRLEVILTVDEEQGLNGAKKIDLSMLQGKRMINLDNEEEGVLLTSCAGGARVKCTISGVKEKRKGSVLEIKVSGLKGGHSGTEIHKGGGNAIHILARVLDAMRQKTSIGLVDIEGGVADNAIPTSAVAYMWAPESDIGNAIDVIYDVSKEIKEEYQKQEENLSIVLSEYTGQSVTCIKQSYMDKIVAFLAAFPNGVQTMSANVEGLVESSLNMGMIQMEGKEITVTFSIRSSVESAKEAIYRKLNAICTLAGARIELSGEYPGWAYREDSPLRDTMVRVYEEMYGKKPKIQAIHAGLECGLISDKIPGLDCISYGPDMQDIHSVNEKLCISSVQRVWEYLLEVLKQRY
ncbi:MAG: aminoacyl-histidine dipeptidase [Lachnospiraceae bacterium]|nr:aminoacyl-histidine dipeptidase [Lachnospiraceae bacterium]